MGVLIGIPASAIVRVSPHQEHRDMQSDADRHKE